MLPGGMMPVTQLITVIRSSPPKSAVSLLAAMPAERLPVVVAAMAPADIARVLPATQANVRDTLLAALSTEQLIDLVHESTNQVITLLPTLPRDRLTSVVDGLTDQVLSNLLLRMPPEGQRALLTVMHPPRAYVVLRRTYECDVARALARGNADVAVAAEPPDGILLVHTLGWRMVVAARYGDDGCIAVRHAEEMAYRLGANGALGVADNQPADDVVRYCRESQRRGRPIDAVAWVDAEDDSILKRALVALCR